MLWGLKPTPACVCRNAQVTARLYYMETQIRDSWKCGGKPLPARLLVTHLHALTYFGLFDTCRQTFWKLVLWTTPTFVLFFANELQLVSKYLRIFCAPRWQKWCKNGEESVWIWHKRFEVKNERRESMQVWEDDDERERRGPVWCLFVFSRGPSTARRGL